MASGVKIPDNEYVVLGLVQAQQELQLLDVLKTSILANSFLGNDKKTNELVNKAIKLIYFEDDTAEIEEEHLETLKSLRNMVFKIDTSSVPMDQDKLIRKK